MHQEFMPRVPVSIKMNSYGRKEKRNKMEFGKCAKTAGFLPNGSHIECAY